MEDLKKAISEIIKEDIIKIVVSNKMNKDVKYNKIAFILKENKKKQYYQIKKYTDKQVFHENIDKDILGEKLLEFIEGNYKQIAAWANNYTFDLKISKKGKVFLSKKKMNNENLTKKGHNKEKITYLKRA